MLMRVARHRRYKEFRFACLRQQVFFTQQQQFFFLSFLHYVGFF